jgi:mannan endo-1,4-beta-mannosidase
VRLLLLAILLQGRPETKPGLIAEYFASGVEIDDFPNVAGKRPSLRRIDAAIDFKDRDGKFGDTEFKEHFYVRWAGLLRAPKDGVYSLYTTSDDGSRLWIDGKLIVDNGGVHGPEQVRGQIDLKAGDHEIRMDYFNSRLGSMCRLSWERHDQAMTAVPAEALFHRKDADLDK